MRRTTREGRGGLGEAHEDLLGDVGTIGDGPDGVPHVQGDVDTEEEEDNHNEASSNILNNSNISKRRKIEKINHNWTEDDLPAGWIRAAKVGCRGKKYGTLYLQRTLLHKAFWYRVKVCCIPNVSTLTWSYLGSQGRYQKSVFLQMFFFHYQ